MKSNADWRALARAGLMTAACILAGGAYAEPVRKPAPREAAAPQPAAGSNLKFFTIAQRVAVLRAAGRLPEPDEASDRPEIVKASLVTATYEPEQRATTKIPNLLGMAVLPVPGGELAAKWQEMAARWDIEKATIDGCRSGPCNHPGVARWLDIEASAGKLSDVEQLNHVHSRINRAISYASDLAAQNAADHWASPLEVIGKLGDCEDYAIAKYMMLRSLGRPAEDLKLVVLFQPWAGMYHAILAVRSGDNWTYLDNQRAGLAGEVDYRGVRAIATLDENGQALLAALPKALAPSAAATLQVSLRDAVY